MSDEARDREGTPGLGASSDGPRLLLAPSKPEALPVSESARSPEASTPEVEVAGEHEATEESEREAPRELGRVADPAAHDAATGARGLLRVEVPAAWLEEGGTLVLEAPERLVCARCEGGGCEGCGNSGALRARTERREVQITLAPGVASAKRVRLDAPFGDDSPVRQLWIDLVPSAVSSGASLRFRPTEHALVVLGAEANPLAHPPRPRPLVVVFVALAVFLLLVLIAKGR